MTLAKDESLGKIRRTLRWIVRVTPWVVIAAIVAGLLYGLVRFYDDEPVTYADDEEHFKYGSTGGERGWKLQFGFGIPYWMWIALPELAPELLPDSEPGRGYSSLGLIYEEDRNPRFELPIGTSIRRVQGIDRVYLNCAFCHTGSIRDEPGGTRRIVLGAPSNTLDLGAFTAFLDGAAKAPQFRDRELMAKIARLERDRTKWLTRTRRLSVLRNRETHGELAAADAEELAALATVEANEYLHATALDRHQPRAWGVLDRGIMRWVGVMLMRDQLLALMGRLRFIDFSTAGPGRVDTFNPPKALLGFDMSSDSVDPDELRGNCDFPSIWYQRARRGMNLHWDGNQCSTDERNLSAAFGTGATPATLDKAKLLQVADWLWDDAQPPKFPAHRIDRSRIARGREIYQQYCWNCHGNATPPFRTPGDGSLVGEVIPIEHVGTDRGRLDSYTPELAAAQNTLYAGLPEKGEAHCQPYRDALCDPSMPDDEFERLREEYLDDCYPARFSHFRKTWGYASAPLEGIWARAPFLHNGSVPTLRDLLEPSTDRPPVFFTGYDVYDYENVGFASLRQCSNDDSDRSPTTCVESSSGVPHVPIGSGWRFDTAARGNGNQGHEGREYGTELAREDKDSLIEYLKTF